MTITARQARVIDADLQRLPLALAENHYLRVAGATCAGETSQLRISVAAKDTVIHAQGRRIGGLQALEQDANTRAAGWRLRAKSRFWTIVGETALLIGITTLAVTR